MGAADAEINIRPTPRVCFWKNCITVKFQSRHTGRSYTQRLCAACPPDKVKSAIDTILTADETKFTKSINLVLIATSGASTGRQYDSHLPRDFDRICEAIKLNGGESVNMSFAIARGKVPVCISPSFGDRWLTPKVHILVHWRCVYLDHRYPRRCGFWNESRRCARCLLWPAG